MSEDHCLSATPNIRGGAKIGRKSSSSEICESRIVSGLFVSMMMVTTKEQ
jgi:hypothetical protein